MARACSSCSAVSTDKDVPSTSKVAMVSPEEKPDPGWVGFALPTTLPGLEGASDATAEILHFPESLRPATVAAAPEDSDEGVATVVARSTFEIASPVTVIEVKGFGRQKGHMEVYRGVEYEVQFLPKVKVDIVVPEEKLEQALTVIQDSAKTGEIGDGKIFVYNVENCIRIRTGESGPEAL